MTSELPHYHYDVFEIPEDPLNPMAGSKLTFDYNGKGEIDRVSVPMEPAVKEIVFTRVPDAAMKSRAFLEPLTGQYLMGPTTVTVSLKGENTLTLTLPGQPTYELVPIRGLSFDLKGLTGFSVEFKKDASDKVTELVFYQPNGTFVARRN